MLVLAAQASLSRMASLSGKPRTDLVAGWVSKILINLHSNISTNFFFSVCDWYHNAPQLFYLHEGAKATIPSSCDKVDLKPE